MRAPADYHATKKLNTPGEEGQQRTSVITRVKIIESPKYTACGQPFSFLIFPHDYNALDFEFSNLLHLPRHSLRMKDDFHSFCGFLFRTLSAQAQLYLLGSQCHTNSSSSILSSPGPEIPRGGVCISSRKL